MVNTETILAIGTFGGMIIIAAVESRLDGKPLTAYKRAARHVRRPKMPVQEHLGNIPPAVSPFDPEQISFREVLGEKTPYPATHRRPARPPQYRPARYQGRL